MQLVTALIGRCKDVVPAVRKEAATGWGAPAASGRRPAAALTLPPPDIASSPVVVGTERSGSSEASAAMWIQGLQGSGITAEGSG